jgi:hypothetical protein
METETNTKFLTPIPMPQWSLCKRTQCLVKLIPYHMALHFDYIGMVARATTGLQHARNRLWIHTISAVAFAIALYSASVLDLRHCMLLLSALRNQVWTGKGGKTSCGASVYLYIQPSQRLRSHSSAPAVTSWFLYPNQLFLLHTLIYVWQLLDAAL